MKYTLVNSGDESTLTVFIDGELYTANNSHPNWTKIIGLVLADDPAAADLFSSAKYVEEKFQNLSDRVAVRGSVVTFDGDVVDNALTQQILRFMEEGVEDWGPLVAFYERVAANPSEHSRENLYRFVEANGVTIDSEGFMRLYKGVQKESDGTYKSISSGTAYVNGVRRSGQIPQTTGDVVTMPRSEVEFNPDVHCHVGLHVGNYTYASNFGRGALLEVKVDPSQVVSVPNDYNSAKMRVCKYEIVGTIDQEYTTGYAYDASDDEDEDYAECEDCGYTEDYCVCPCDCDLCDYEDEDEDEEDDTPIYTQTQKYTRPTSQNFAQQKRDATGRFIPKS